MNAIKILAIALIVAGILGLAYGKFSYTRESHNATMGPFHFSVKDTETVNIPLWAGVVAIVAGGVLLLAPTKSLPGN
jgi:multidrug transporter EmrE-like cation transporter